MIFVGIGLCLDLSCALCIFQRLLYNISTTVAPAFGLCDLIGPQWTHSFKANICFMLRWSDMFWTDFTSQPCLHYKQL